MSMSNDREEGISTIKLLKEICSSMKELGQPTALADAYDYIDTLPSFNDGLGLCLSSEGDMLSQWRGYADDGHGVSIGFDTQRLRVWLAESSDDTLDVELVRITYAKETAREKLRPLAEGLIHHALAGRFSRANRKAPTLTVNPTYLRWRRQLIDQMYRFKNEAFKEEKEWRLLSSFNPDRMSGGFGVHPTRSVLKPFATLNFAEHTNIITDVKIGPKNTTTEAVLAGFLRSVDMDIDIDKSTATYR